MMRKILVVLLCHLVFNANAQVTIPDTNFRNALKKQILQCFNGDLLNLDSAKGITSLEVSYSNISSLDGLEYFTSLTTLICNDNLLTNLPALPTTLQYFDCGYNFLSSLPTLPISLQYLNCDGNQLTNLPASLNTLKYLSCSSNRLKNLPSLPNSLGHIDCENNQLKSLPPLPIYLQYLYCRYNDLTNLPILPNSLAFLSCYGNYLTTLPTLPINLIELECYDNPLTCLPFLPKKITTLYTDVTCIPNIPSGLHTSLPICNFTNNKNNCKAFPIVSGRVLTDINKNGTKDANEYYTSNVKVVLQSKGYSTFSNDSGYYEIAVDVLGNYNVSVENPNYYTSAAQTASFTSYSQIDTLNFALQPTKIAKDISIKITNYHRIVRGFSMPFKVEIENEGTVATPATLSVDLPNYFTINSTSGFGTNIGNNTWYYPNLLPGQKISGYIDGYVSASAPVGDSLHFAAYVNPTDTEDSTLIDNTSRLGLLVYGSLDPNDKEGPKTITPTQVAKSEFIEYTIRFQNVGNAPAVTVVIADTLNQNLLANTLELLGTSHICKTTVKGNQVYFEFLNIMLPDSVNHESESHGYVRFRVKPRNTLVLGNTISNTASIYFDYNSPVVTNTVVTKVSQPIVTAIETSHLETETIKVFPNPTKGYFNIRTKQTGNLEITDMSGQLLYKHQIENQSEQIDISELKAGTYLYRFVTNDGIKFGKVVKQ